MDHKLAWRIEETCLKAFPALRQVVAGDWLLRFSEGVSRRANSANPLRPPGCVDIEEVRRLYSAQGQDPLFRCLSFLEPRIDQEIAAAGFAQEGETSVLFGTLDEVSARFDPAVETFDRLDEDWLKAMNRLNGRSTEQAEIYANILLGLAVPTRFVGIRVDGDWAALAFGAVSNKLLCYESVITAPQYRGRGLARRLLESLAAWAEFAGADGHCLQVQSDNQPGLALYRRFGLGREVFRYHYRRGERRHPGASRDPS